ncbi:MAG: hypothetical protein H0X39_03035 [Actinobacteria bacterium]|nr:hypothetical protein [Actinomycetota bacterium]
MLVAANGEQADDDPVVEAIRELGPLTGPQLRATTGLSKQEVDRSIALLHQQLVLTNARLEAEGSTWGALARDLLARKWRLPKRLPAREQARRELAAVVLGHAGELSGSRRCARLAAKSGGGRARRDRRGPRRPSRFPDLDAALGWGG